MIITISRQTGSGGHTVGRLLAEKLGYEFYDKEIVASVAASMGIDEKLILENGENMSDQDYSPCHITGKRKFPMRKSGMHRKK